MAGYPLVISPIMEVLLFLSLVWIMSYLLSHVATIMRAMVGRDTSTGVYG